jgi:hypothetical protein
MATGRGCRWLIAVHCAYDSKQRGSREHQREHQRKGAKSHDSTSIHTPYSSTPRSLNALPITDTELNVIAALAIIGLSNRPNQG